MRWFYSLLCSLLALLAVHPVVAFAEEPPAAWFGVVNAHVDPTSADDLGASWTRIPFFWSDIEPGRREWFPERAVSDKALARELESGREVVGVILSTPAWAARDASQGPGAVPANLELPIDHPENHWARFVSRLAIEYAGRIDTWILWNEPDFQPGDRANGGYVPWAGNERDFYQLIRTGAQAIRAANPDAKVVFAASSYWIDVVNGRPPFLQRWLEVAKRDPEAIENGFWVDAVALNLYCSADHVYVIGSQFRSLLDEAGADIPVWLTETNCPPSDDRDTPDVPAIYRTTLAGQASFLLEAFAAARAAGYERVAWYQLRDGSDPYDTYALVRRDGTRRPAFEAFLLASELLLDAEEVTYVGLDPEGNEYPVEGIWPWPEGRLARIRNADHEVLIAWSRHPDGLHVTLEAPPGEVTAVDIWGRPVDVEWTELGLRVALPPSPPAVRGDADHYYRFGGTPVIMTIRYCDPCSTSS